MNVLITSAGTASAVSVLRALRMQQEEPLGLVAVDADPTAPGLYLADHHHVIPKCAHPDYLPTLLRLCEEHRIRALFPIYSREIEVIAENAALFTERGIGLLVPPPDVVRLCNDKRRMYALVEALDIPTPRLIVEDRPETYPLFAKPNAASGSTGALRIDDARDWDYARAKFPDFLFQEFVEGPEHTIDGLCDRQSRLIVGSARVRLATKAGQCVKGRTVDAPDLLALCARICRAVGLVGPCNLQFIQRGDEHVFIELNPRYAAGGLMLTVHAGANLPLLALRLMRGQETAIPRVRPGVTMVRYYEEIILEEEAGR